MKSIFSNNSEFASDHWVTYMSMVKDFLFLSLQVLKKGLSKAVWDISFDGEPVISAYIFYHICSQKFLSYPDH